MSILTHIKNFFRIKPKIIVVLGQTSTGKSDLAVEIAEQYNGEVISADSRQVYRGLDLGSGKITKEEMREIPHHLLDVANPRSIFSAFDFQKQGTEAIQNILAKNKLPIICGGTGFYIDSLLQKNTLAAVPSNPELRALLEKKTLAELQSLLQETSPKTYKKIDIKNPVRIVRALEIIEEYGYIPKNRKYKKYNILYVGLQLPKEELHTRIHARIIKRLDKGMLDEARDLIQDGVSHERLQALGLEYRFMSKHLLGELSYEEMIEWLYRATVKFAKRQRTWFKRNKNIHWFHPITEKENIYKEIDNFLK